VEELSGQLGRLREYLPAAGPDSGPDLIAAVQESGTTRLKTGRKEGEKGPVELIYFLT
jgi:hypothetical protein